MLERERRDSSNRHDDEHLQDDNQDHLDSARQRIREQLDAISESLDQVGLSAGQAQQKDVVPPGTFHGVVARAEQASVFEHEIKEGGRVFKFTFAIQHANSNYRIYIRRQPRYLGRSTSPHVTHMLRDESSPYVCWRGRIPSVEAAAAIARAWAKGTVRYILTGKPF